MTTDRVPVRDDLVDVSPYGAPQLDVPVRLNTNETPQLPATAWLDDVAAAMKGLELNRYPDRRATALRERLGLDFDLPASRVWAANGSNEILVQLFQAYGGPGRKLLLFRPGYSAHPLLARVAGTPVVEHDLPEDFALTVAHATQAAGAIHPDIVCIASPNNPTGVPVALDAIEALHDAMDGLLIVDEAYVEFGAESAVALLDRLPRLVVVRTFSKAFRLAGLRLGYLLARDWVIDDLRRVRLPYHLDAVKQVAGLRALEHRDQLLDHIPVIVAERERVAAALADLHVVTWPSAANFILFRAGVEDLFDRLLDRGVLVRDFSTSAGTEGCLRVTIGTPAENDAFLEALSAVLKETA
ncbi:MAG: histidinol-phosphate transaminase [Nitriliruptorales bacterium]|nr:histidinol-phosphate transaminase [Nitriliruptorales bacterium]